MKMVINKCYGGFGLSDKAIAFIQNENWQELERTDQSLIDAVNVLSYEANGDFANLKIVEIPSYATDYELIEYDGFETVFYVVDGRIHSV